MSDWGGQTMVAALRRVVVRRPDEAFAAAEPEVWHYAARPDLSAAQRQHDQLAGLLRDAGAEVLYHDTPLPAHADAVFVHDPVLITDRGAVVLRMGKSLRRGEETELARTLGTLGVPIAARLEAPATAEGGDLMWLDRRTLAVGRGFRTNAEGIHQLRHQLGDDGVQVLAFDLPYADGPTACLHLMSVISMVDDDLAVVFPPLLPVALWQELQRRRVACVEVPENELASMGPNVLALAPRRCLMLEGNPITTRRLRDAGCQVHTYDGSELSLKAEGGATCLTRPILRGPSPG
jgi:N-dimethylarginine dimethylaminohydrolase